MPSVGYSYCMYGRWVRVMIRCYPKLIAIRTAQEARERRQVMPTWTPTTDQKSLNKRVTTIGSNQFETSSIPI